MACTFFPNCLASISYLRADETGTTSSLVPCIIKIGPRRLLTSEMGESSYAPSSISYTPDSETTACTLAPEDAMSAASPPPRDLPTKPTLPGAAAGNLCAASMRAAAFLDKKALSSPGVSGHRYAP